MLKRLLFKNEFKQMERLMRDNVELQGIVLDQIEMIQELEDKNAHLDFKLEDAEIHLEHVKEKLEDAQEEIGELENKIADLQYELQNREEF